MLTLALLHMRFGFEDGAGYPYGYFKVISFSAPLAGVLFVNGLWQMGRDARRLPGQAPLLVQSAAMLLFAGISLLATFHMVVTAHHTATQRTFAHPGTLEVQEIRSLIPPDEPLLIIDPRHVYQLWTAYLIDHPQMFFRVRPHTYAAPPQVASHAFIKYAIIAQKGRATPGGALPDEPWFSEETTEVLWESADYVLVRRTDQVIADMPLSISSRHLSLHTPTTLHLSEDTLHIEGAFAERPPHLSQPITQTLAGRPTHVSIITESSEGGGLHITYSNGDEETYSLVASRQRFVLEVDVPVTLQLSQFSAGTVWVLDVRVIGQEGP
jgi:hypothetical protein